MTETSMGRSTLLAAVVVMTGLVLPAATEAQTATSLRVTRRAVVMDTPRSDGFVVGTLAAGEVLTILEQAGSWYLVNTPDRMPRRRGWIQAGAAEVVGAKPITRPPSGRMQIRGFAQAGGTLFEARNSFETILGTAFGTVYGVGGQVAFPNGAFVEASVEQFRKTGSRVLASGTTIFTLPIANTVTVTPVHATVGYRERKYGRIVPYLGMGLGWQTLQEASPSLEESRRAHVGYHIVAGAELSLVRWVSVAGEIQRTVVPSVLGDTGVSVLFPEDDLGGTAFRFKLIVGR